MEVVLVLAILLFFASLANEYRILRRVIPSDEFVQALRFSSIGFLIGYIVRLFSAMHSAGRFALTEKNLLEALPWAFTGAVILLFGNLVGFYHSYKLKAFIDIYKFKSAVPGSLTLFADSIFSHAVESLQKMEGSRTSKTFEYWEIIGFFLTTIFARESNIQSFITTHMQIGEWEKDDYYKNYLLQNETALSRGVNIQRIFVISNIELGEKAPNSDKYVWTKILSDHLELAEHNSCYEPFVVLSCPGDGRVEVPQLLQINFGILDDDVVMYQVEPEAKRYCLSTHKEDITMYKSKFESLRSKYSLSLKNFRKEQLVNPEIFESHFKSLIAYRHQAHGT